MNMEDNNPRFVRVQASKTANTKFISIPSKFSEKLGLRKSDYMKISLQDGSKLLLERIP